MMSKREILINVIQLQLDVQSKGLHSARLFISINSPNNTKKSSKLGKNIGSWCGLVWAARGVRAGADACRAGSVQNQSGVRAE